jgi:AcrR family transcriptional regulator
MTKKAVPQKEDVPPPSARGQLRPGRAVLLRTAVALMGEKGYEGASTRDIAAAAGVTVAALYHHFPSKLDLLRAFLFDAYDIVLARLRREAAAAGPQAEAQLSAVVAVLISANLHSEYAQLACRVAAREYERLPESDQAVVLRKRDEIVGVIAGIVRTGRPERRPPASETAWAIFHLCMAAVERQPASGLSMEAIIPIYQRFALELAGAEDQAKPARSRVNASPSTSARLQKAKRT